MAMALRWMLSKSPSPMASVSLLSSARAFASLPLLAGSAPLPRLRPLVAAVQTARWLPAGPVRGGGGRLRCFSTRPTTSSLNDPSPNWSNRPPKETILLDGCDFEHWLVVMEPPEEGTTRDDIIDSYIKTLAQIVGCEDEARMKIYSVSTKHYFAFGALVSEELSYKLKALPRVRWVLPDSYLDVKNKDYGGEPFINGQAVPYDPKYHEEWVRNNARANERSRRNDRPRNFDRSRNFERRRENMQNREFQNRTPMPNLDLQNREGQNPMTSPPGPNLQGTMPPPGGMPNRGPPPNLQYSNREGGAMPNPSYQGAPYQNQGPGYQNNYSPPMHNPEFQNRGLQNPPPPLAPGPNVQGTAAHMPPSGGTPNRDVPPYMQQQSGPPPQGMPYQSQGPSYQGNYVPNRDGNISGGNTYQGDGNFYQRGGAPHQGTGSAQQGVGNAYGGSGGPYQGSQTSGGYAGGGNAYQVGGGGSFQGSGSAPQARDIAGRD